MKGNYRHGHASGGGVTSTYKSWSHMVGRCTLLTDNDYPRYGGRGIKVCPRWRVFENFLDDMGEAPVGMTIDRTNNDGDYEPGNCQWVSRQRQAQNYSRNIVVEIDGTSKCLKEWCDLLGASYSIVHQRVRKLGWPPTKALMTPARWSKS